MTKRQPEFVVARAMPLGTRLIWVAGLAVVGFTVQILAGALIGLALIIAAVVLAAVRGTSNEPSGVGSKEWRNVTNAELDEARRLLMRVKSVEKQTNVFSPQSASGCGLGFVALLGVGFVAVALLGSLDRTASASSAFSSPLSGGSLTALFVIDALVMLLPLWLFGRVKPWQPPDFDVRLNQLMPIYNAASQDSRLEVQPSMLVAKTDEGQAPMDCRLMVKIRDTDPNFMGIQTQTTFNTVQSKKYPYSYCVLIAKPEFDLISKAKLIIEMPPQGGFSVGLFADANAKKERNHPRFGDCIVEVKTEKDVQIAVIRQKTSGTGYHTTPEQALAIYEAAQNLALRLTGA